MALSRPMLIALLAGLVAIAGLMAVRTVRGGEDTESLPGEDAAQVAAPAGELRSGRLSVRLEASDLAGGSQGESGSMELSGAFQAGEAGDAPSFDFRLAYESPDESGSFGIVSTGNRGFVTENGTGHELPAEAWAQITALRSQADGGRSVPQVDLGALGALENRKAGPGPEIDGVATERVTGDVDVPGFLRAISSLSQLAGEGSSLSGAAERDIATIVERARVESLEGEDGVPRRFLLDLRLAVPARLRERFDGFASGRAKVSIDLSDVNRPQSIGVPKKISKGEPSSDVAGLGAPLLAMATLAIDPPATAQAPAARQPAASPAAPAPAAGEGVPARVAKALDNQKIVVLLFTQDGGDDAATRASLRDIRRVGDRGVVTFQDSVVDLADYRRVVSDLGISRAPALVVIGPDRQASVLEGYTDSGTLAQAIRDAR